MDACIRVFSVRPYQPLLPPEQLMSLEATFLAPMREFVKRELKEVRDLKETVHKAHEEYLQQLQKV